MENKDNGLCGKLAALLKKYKMQIRYLFVGGMTTVVDFVISFLLYTVMNHHWANVIAWLGAVVFAFVTNKLWVFESKSTGTSAILSEIVGFAGGRVFSLLVQEGLFVLFVDVMQLNKMLIKICVAVIVVILNYILGKLVFLKKNKK